VPLLAKTATGFEPRAASGIAALLKAAYGAHGDPARLQSRLEAIAQALNSTDFGLAAIAAVQMRMPVLSSESAARVARAEEKLRKYNYNPDEPRDWHGRWTRNGAAGPAPGGEGAQRPEPHAFDARRRVVENASLGGGATLSDAEASDDFEKPEHGDDSSEPTSLEQMFERKYDDLGPVDFSNEVIQFGYWLERTGRNLSPAELAHALAEYSFLQDRLSFWLAYENKPATAHANLISAALTLFQGAVNGGIVRSRDLPKSMVDVAGQAWAFDNVPPRRRLPSKIPAFGNPPAAPANAPKDFKGIGGFVYNSRAKIRWRRGIKDQGNNWSDYYGEQNPDARELPPGSKTFDHFRDATGEAISEKTMNTLSVSYIKNPQRIYRQVARYVDAAVDYEPRTEPNIDPTKIRDINPAAIKSKTIQLAIPEYTNPEQWRYLNRAIIYGKENGISVVITRIRF
jgi:hypothetical protein